MGEVIWGTRKPGDVASVGESEDGGGHVILADAPNWVRLPKELGGGQTRVLGVEILMCVCGVKHMVKTFDLECGLCVSECQHRGFMFWIKTVDVDKQ